MNILSAVKQALNALESVEQVHPADDMIQEAIDNLRAAIEQVEKMEPVAVVSAGYANHIAWLPNASNIRTGTLLYTYPPDAQAEIDRLTKENSELRAQLAEREGWQNEPVCGKNYEAGLWSRRNYESWVEDQQAQTAAPKPGEK